MMIIIPDELEPYVEFDPVEVLVAKPDLPKELEEDFIEFKEECIKIKQERRNELLSKKRK